MHSNNSWRQTLLSLCLVALLAAVGCEYHYVHTSGTGNAFFSAMAEL